MTIKQLRDIRVLRFAVVGTINAAISFGILNLCFYKLGIGKIVSSIIATSCSLIFSFFMNRNMVFMDKTHSARRQAIPFIIVTISGSLILLNIVYVMCLKIINGHELFIINGVKSLSGLVVSRNLIDINFSTLIGAVAAMFWNYNGYRLFVFSEDTSETVDT